MQKQVDPWQEFLNIVLKVIFASAPNFLQMWQTYLKFNDTKQTRAADYRQGRTKPITTLSEYFFTSFEPVKQTGLCHLSFKGLAAKKIL